VERGKGPPFAWQHTMSGQSGCLRSLWAVIVFGNLTSYPVEHVTAVALRAHTPRPWPAGPAG